MTTTESNSPTSTSDTGGGLGSLLSDFLRSIGLGGEEGEAPTTPAGKPKLKRKRGVVQPGEPAAAAPATPLLPAGALAPVARVPGVAESIGAGASPGLASRAATYGTKALSTALSPAVTSTVGGATGAAGQSLAVPLATQTATKIGAGAASKAIPIVGPIAGEAAGLGIQAAQGQPITGEDIGGAALGAGGGIAGGLGGAAAGAAAGSAVPGIGTAIGALIGGILGSTLGGAAGSQGGKAIGRAAGGGKAKLAQAGSSQPFGSKYAPGSSPYEQGVGPRVEG